MKVAPSSPFSLNKYLYANGNPVGFVDPTGKFSIAEFSAAESIRNTLAGIQADAGGYLISATLNDGDYGLKEFLIDTALNVAVVGTFLALPYLYSKAFGSGIGVIPPLGGRGPSNRSFDINAAGGAIKQLTTRSVKITNKGIDRVVNHINGFEYDPSNQYMISRLKEIANGKIMPTQVDINFYTHELREGFRFQKLGYRPGINYPPINSEELANLWNNTHSATIEDFGGIGAKITDLYHPEALRLSDQYTAKKYGIKF
ncbi:MAG: hypothetical protein ACKPCM_19945 [Pseudanabaena sp.]